MEKRIAVAMIVINEEVLLPISLGCVANWADKIVILDGSPSGVSTDGTRQVVESFTQFPVYRKKIIYESGSWGTDNWSGNWDEVQRNAYLRYVEDCDFLFQVDADEFYMQSHLDIIRRIVDDPQHEGLTGLLMGNLHFWRDYEHYLVGVGEDNIRFSKLESGVRYTDNSVLLRDTGGVPIGTRNILTRRDVVRFHHGHAIPWEYYKSRLAKFVKRGENKTFKMEDYENWEDPRSLDAGEIRVYRSPYPALMMNAIVTGNPYFKKVDWPEHSKVETK